MPATEHSPGTVQTFSGASNVREVRQLPGAVSEPLRFHADLVEHGQLQIGQRRVFRDPAMPAALKPPPRPPRAPDPQLGWQSLLALPRSRTLLGADGCRRGMDLYIERHGGMAVTCDDFRAAMGDANQRDLLQFERWYSQAGTPLLHAEGAWDGSAGRYSLTFTQRAP